MKKPKKHLVIFLLMGLIGTNLEIVSRWLGEDLVRAQFNQLSFASAAGWTSIWMFGIYGMGGVILGELNATRLGRRPMAVQALAALAIMLAIELVSGCILNLGLGLDIWDYSQQQLAWGGRTVPLHLQGQVCVPTAIQFFFLAPLAFWVDDMIRWVAYDEARPSTLASYYRSLLRRAPRNRAPRGSEVWALGDVSAPAGLDRVA